ncbi:Peptidoglycan-recognition protein SA [Eumeta japonica]|uniref:Peptidoglycan-recognition protein SA n=1 Tax=Eumeta variegata TaxID=151549 RepID=A0A4C1SU59_EUMVA|nr:Peptidoglycan-recognition protein SA [Eumeta japonica]
MPLQLILRGQWDPSNITEESLLLRSALPSKAHHVIITPTNTDQCYGLERCRKLLINMKKSNENETAELPYNFFISSNGFTFEGLGWRKTSLLYPELRNHTSYVLGLIDQKGKPVVLITCAEVDQLSLHPPKMETFLVRHVAH